MVAEAKSLFVRIGERLTHAGRVCDGIKKGPRARDRLDRQEALVNTARDENRGETVRGDKKKMPGMGRRGLMS